MVNILLVEDDDVDAEAVRRGFAKARVDTPIFRASTGVQALEQLRSPNSPLKDSPYIILLDLKMPQMNGIEFLDAVRNDQLLSKSIVFVLTTSNDSQDRTAAYDRFVAGYITKSKAGVDFHDLIHMLDHYRRVVELPRSG